MKMLLAALLTGTAAQAAEPFPLVLSSAPGRVAKTDDDWVQMIPVAQHANEDPVCDSPEFHEQKTSPNGRYVYQMVCRAVTSDLIIRVDLSTGERREVSDGNSLSIIRDGPYAGDLLIERHRYYKGPEGGSYDPTYVITPEGKEVLMVPGTDGDAGDAAVKPWLDKNGWQAW